MFIYFMGLMVVLLIIFGLSYGKSIMPNVINGTLPSLQLPLPFYNTPSPLRVPDENLTNNEASTIYPSIYESTAQRGDEVFPSLMENVSLSNKAQSSDDTGISETKWKNLLRRSSMGNASEDQAKDLHRSAATKSLWPTAEDTSDTVMINDQNSTENVVQALKSSITPSTRTNTSNIYNILLQESFKETVSDQQSTTGNKTITPMESNYVSEQSALKSTGNKDSLGEK